MTLNMTTALGAGAVIYAANETSVSQGALARIRQEAEAAGNRIGLPKDFVETIEKLRKDLQPEANRKAVAATVSGVDREWIRLYAAELQKGLGEVEQKFTGESSAAKSARKVIDAWNSEWATALAALGLRFAAPFPAFAPIVDYVVLGSTPSLPTGPGGLTLRTTQLPRTLQRALREAHEAIEAMDELGVAQATTFIEQWSKRAVSPRRAPDAPPSLSAMQVTLLQEELATIRKEWNPLAAVVMLDRLHRYLDRGPASEGVIATPIIGRFLEERIALARVALETSGDAVNQEDRSWMEGYIQRIYGEAAEAQIRAANDVSRSGTPTTDFEVSRLYTREAMSFAEKAGAELTADQSLLVWNGASAHHLMHEASAELSARIVDAFAERGWPLQLELSLREPESFSPSADLEHMRTALPDAYLHAIEDLSATTESGAEAEKAWNQALEVLVALTSFDDPAAKSIATQAMLRRFMDTSDRDIRAILPDWISLVRPMLQRRFPDATALYASVDRLAAASATSASGRSADV